MGTKKFKRKPDPKKSRKQIRKEERKNKKARRHEYYSNRKKPGQFVLAKKPPEDNNHTKPTKKQNSAPAPKQTKFAVEQSRETEKKHEKQLQKEMQKQRNKQLKQANLDEDKNIRHLEKQLKLNKRKSKAVPTSFVNDGLDYLLEVCDSENLKNSALAEQQLAEVNEDFEEDFILMTEGPTKKKKMEKRKRSDSSQSLEESQFSDEDSESNKNKKLKIDKDITPQKTEEKGEVSATLSSDDESDFFGDEIDVSEDEKVLKNENDLTDSDLSNEDLDNLEEEQSDEDLDDSHEKKNDGTWEDIYGRLRTKDGAVLNENQKYIPRAARQNEESSGDTQRVEKLQRLRRQLKGLINRLAESNMHSIATQIEELYMSNSRNDMNNTLTELIVQALVSYILAPERLLMEHILLVIILHANVGTEVGAHFLQTVVKMFDENSSNSVEDKKLDNITIILAQLYNFKLFDSKLIYEIIEKLSEKFGEKDVECILHILRTVGFNLRKDNPDALKNLILSLQKKASTASDDMKNNSRVKYMLDILLAIKNNNVTKIPNYDTTYSEHLKKIMKSFIRKGNYVTQLNISLEDLLKADEKGKWWVVGSAWEGNSSENVKTKNSAEKVDSFSQKLLELAVKQRMNTDARKNIFCIIMSAEDYLDAFEKLLKLSLKNQQEREIIHVILHCCLQEKTYNPYYATLAQKFCEHDRKFQMTIKYSIWDKLKALKEHSATQISHLAKLLSHLFVDKGLPISTLKIIQFNELDKVTLRFIRQILLGILLHEDLDVCRSVFENISFSEKLKMFRESLRLFLHHFLWKNLDSQGIADDRKELLQERIKIIEKMLVGKANKFL